MKSEKGAEIISKVQLHLSAMPVGDGAIPVVALSLQSPTDSSPTYLMPLVDTDFTLAYMEMLKIHLQAVQHMYDDFMSGNLGDPGEYSQA